MIRGVLIFLVSCAVSSLAFAQSQSGGDAAAGRVLAKKFACTDCHGPDGNGNTALVKYKLGDIPRISAQPQPYFARALHEYKRGARPQYDMQVMAKQLSDEEISDLAAWYASQTPRAVATYEYHLDR